MHLNDYGEQFDGCLFEEGESFIADYTDVLDVLVCLIGFFLRQLVDVELALVLALVEQVVGDLDGVVRVVDCLLVLMDLTQEGADLHVRFALIF